MTNIMESKNQEMKKLNGKRIDPILKSLTKESLTKKPGDPIQKPGVAPILLRDTPKKEKPTSNTEIE